MICFWRRNMSSFARWFMKFCPGSDKVLRYQTLSWAQNIDNLDLWFDCRLIQLYCLRLMVFLIFFDHNLSCLTLNQQARHVSLSLKLKAYLYHMYTMPCYWLTIHKAPFILKLDRIALLFFFSSPPASIAWIISSEPDCCCCLWFQLRLAFVLIYLDYGAQSRHIVH